MWRGELDREKDSILVQLGADIDVEREAQGLTVAVFADRARLSKRGVVYTRKIQCDPKLSTLIAQAKALGRRLSVTLEPNRGERDV